MKEAQLQEERRIYLLIKRYESSLTLAESAELHELQGTASRALAEEMEPIRQKLRLFTLGFDAGSF